MFSILIVEDTSEKLKNIYKPLKELSNFESLKIDHEIDALNAKNLLKQKAYDLMILDIAIPPSKDKDVELEGGLELLKEIKARDIYNIPTHIIGLTGRDEIYEKAESVMSNDLLSIIRYSSQEIEWELKLKAAIGNWMEAKKSIGSSVEYDFDVVILCALEEELNANLENGWNWNQKNLKNDNSIYYIAEVSLNNNEKIKIVAAKAERMGMPASSAMATKMVMLFKPRYIFMTGIMAGVTGRVKLGDIVISDPVWDWGSGKWVSEDNKENSLFQFDPYQFRTDPSLLKNIRLFQKDDQHLFNIRNKFKSGNKPDTILNIHIGPVASGASVLSDQEQFNRIKDQHRKLLGIEMESYGIYSAVEVSHDPRPLPISIKAVVDFGDSKKSDDVHEYGAFVTAQLAKDLAERLFS
ncbi:hypothetical protein LDL76_08725 [Salegentibacter mishustinae]|uniref:phosphorylase family protein n=1 Tax=Salegentibacter mishustinae TaxID=270918 RepID=UPI001CE0356F|nr:hypothetical protein [Salegentibacter mishustinae]UBZ08780.1 hypothetical protein LDL76_08725 [Salegentibacter mishustinae]